MMTKNADKKREQMMMFSMDDMVPQNHMLRLIDRAINWNFIYDLVEEKYCPNNGRPSMDPVMLIKIPLTAQHRRNGKGLFRALQPLSLPLQRL